jgi:hypothetical protein
MRLWLWLIFQMVSKISQGLNMSLQDTVGWLPKNRWFVDEFGKGDDEDDTGRSCSVR